MAASTIRAWSARSVDYVSKVGSGERAARRLDHHPAGRQESLLGNEYSVTRKIRRSSSPGGSRSVLTKQQILELYLNQIFLGRNAYGVQAAARAYFDKDVDQLTPRRMRLSRDPAQGAEQLRSRSASPSARSSGATGCSARWRATASSPPPQRDAAQPRAARHGARRRATASATSAAISWRKSAAS